MLELFYSRWRLTFYGKSHNWTTILTSITQGPIQEYDIHIDTIKLSPNFLLDKLATIIFDAKELLRQVFNALSVGEYCNLLVKCTPDCDSKCSLTIIIMCVLFGSVSYSLVTSTDYVL